MRTYIKGVKNYEDFVKVCHHFNKDCWVGGDKIENQEKFEWLFGSTKEKYIYLDEEGIKWAYAEEIDKYAKQDSEIEEIPAEKVLQIIFLEELIKKL